MRDHELDINQYELRDELDNIDKIIIWKAQGVPQ